MTARYARGILALAGFCFAPFLRAQGSTPLQIITDSLPAGTVGTAYNQQIVTAGGTCLGYGTGSSLLDAGALPPGLIVTSPSATEQWFLQGTPTIAGTYPFTMISTAGSIFTGAYLAINRSCASGADQETTSALTMVPNDNRPSSVRNSVSGPNSTLG